MTDDLLEFRLNALETNSKELMRETKKINSKIYYSTGFLTGIIFLINIIFK